MSGAALVKAIPMTVPEGILRQDAEKKRAKKGILRDSGEETAFEKTLYLPYLVFTYQYPNAKGLFSKQTVIQQGRSVVMALREVEFGFAPELVALASHVVDVESDFDSIVQGVDSTLLVNERLEELKRILADYDTELSKLTQEYDSMAKTGKARGELKENIDHLKRTREERSKMFVDGLKLPSRIDLAKVELLEGNLFYIPYFITKLSGGAESRFIVWDRRGKENELISEELTKNHKFRELILSHNSS